MLNNFIYAETKDLFLNALNNEQVLDEAIVFIADTKEIWNRGHYFGGGIDEDVITNIQTSIANLDATKLSKIEADGLYALKEDIPDLEGYVTQSWIESNYLPLTGGTITGMLTIGNDIIPYDDWACSLGSPDVKWANIYGEDVYADYLAAGELEVQSINVMYVTSSGLFPKTDNYSSLGSTSKKWKNVYANDVVVSNEVTSTYATLDFITTVGIDTAERDLSLSTVESVTLFDTNSGTEIALFRGAGSIIYSDLEVNGDITVNGASVATQTWVGSNYLASSLLGTNTLIHSGNYSSYALPLTGGSINGNLTIAEDITISGITNINSFNSGYGSTDYMIVNKNLSIGTSTNTDNYYLHVGSKASLFEGPVNFEGVTTFTGGLQTYNVVNTVGLLALGWSDGDDKYRIQVRENLEGYCYNSDFKWKLGLDGTAIFTNTLTTTADNPRLILDTSSASPNTQADIKFRRAGSDIASIGAANNSYNFYIQAISGSNKTFFIVDDGKLGFAYNPTLTTLTSYSEILHTGNLSANLPTYLSAAEYISSMSTATSVASVPVTYNSCKCTVSANGSFSLASTPDAGRCINVLIYNSGSSAITITMPTSSTYVNLGSDSLTIAAGGYGEINAFSDGSKIYLRNA